MSERPTQAEIDEANASHAQEVLALAEDIWGGKISVHQMPKFIALSAKLREKDAVRITSWVEKLKLSKRQLETDLSDAKNTITSIRHREENLASAMRDELSEKDKEIERLRNELKPMSEIMYGLSSEVDEAWVILGSLGYCRDPDGNIVSGPDEWVLQNRKGIFDELTKMRTENERLKDELAAANKRAEYLLEQCNSANTKHISALAALEGEHLCVKHQGNHSHYAENNCTICKLESQLAQLRKELEEAKETLFELKCERNPDLSAARQQERDRLAAIVKEAGEQEPVAYMTKRGAVYKGKHCSDDELALYAHPPIREGWDIPAKRFITETDTPEQQLFKTAWNACCDEFLSAVKKD